MCCGASTCKGLVSRARRTARPRGAPGVDGAAGCAALWGMLARLMILFIAVPLIELALLIRVGQWLGVLATVLIVLVTGVAGAALARREGLRTLWRIQADLRAGRFPMGRLLDGVMILFAGGLLLTPGLLTDVVGLSMLVPASRAWLKRRVADRVRRLVESGSTNVTIYYDPPI